jgi:hypothetical protein
LPDFDRIFRPFTLKTDAELAATNWFQDAKRRKQNVDAHVIVIDADEAEDDDVKMLTPEPDPNMNPRGKFVPFRQGVWYSQKWWL